MSKNERTNQMEGRTAFPIDHTNNDLKRSADELSKRILNHVSSKDNFENLVRDSVLYNVAYMELQNRTAAKSNKQMVFLTWISAFVAIASLLVAWRSYSASRSGDEWQRRQQELLESIDKNTLHASSISSDTTAPLSMQVKSTFSATAPSAATVSTTKNPRSVP